MASYPLATLEVLMHISIRYAHRLDLPDEVFKHPSIKEIERIGTDLVVL